jgi:hypothetical protein
MLASLSLCAALLYDDHERPVRAWSALGAHHQTAAYELVPVFFLAVRRAFSTIMNCSLHKSGRRWVPIIDCGSRVAAALHACLPALLTCLLLCAAVPYSCAAAQVWSTLGAQQRFWHPNSCCCACLHACLLTCLLLCAAISD